MIYDLLESEEKWLSYTRLKSMKSSKSILQKIKLKFFEGSKARVLSELISVKMWNLTKICIFHFFLSVVC